MHVDVLIVGQGLSGSLLSWFLQKEGKTFLVIDDATSASASSVAAGIINPVTGRRYVTTWMIEDLVDFAKLTYNELSQHLDLPLMRPTSIIDFFPSAQMRNAFVDRIEENDTYLHAYPDQNSFNPYFNYEFGCGEISPVYMVAVQQFLQAWVKKLTSTNSLWNQHFDLTALAVEKEGIRYKDLTADRIVFCDGIHAANNPWFSLLPFSANKGEVLIIECKDLPPRHIYKKGMMLAPLGDGTFWLGSNYQWEFEDDRPSAKFLQAAESLLKQWLKLPFTIIHHKAAIRPATLERRPFVGFHPQHAAIGILNGLGTKGSSLAPFFAHQLAQHIVYNFPIAAEADVQRFQRILSK